MTIEEPKARNRRKRPAARTTLAPVEIAMEVAASGRTPAAAAMAVLDANAALMHDQAGLTREQIGLSRKQLVLASNEIFRNRIRSIRDIAIATVVVALVLAAGAAVWSASRTTGLVIQPFSVPPNMTERGLDGASVAALFLDELSQLQDQTDSGRAPSSFRNNWGDDLTVEIANTGVSVDDVYKVLVGWVGNETRMTGGISQGPNGLSIVVRTGSRPIQAATGGEVEMDALLRLAAERVYEQTQPYRYATLLLDRARVLPPGLEREAMMARRNTILRGLTTSESPVDRAWAYNGLGVDGDRQVAELIPLLRAGLAVDPDHPFLLGNLAESHESLGRDEAALDWGKRALAAMRRRPADLNPRVIPANEARSGAAIAESLGDFSLAAKLLSRAAVVANANSSADTSPPDQAEALARAHDPSGASAPLRTLDLPDDVAVATRIGTRAMSLPYAAIAEEREQWRDAVQALQGADATYARTLILREAIRRRTELWPRLAYARARIGDLAGAKTLIDATPLDCYLCVRERARIAELAGDRAAADRWSAEARRQGPSLPFAFAERGRMLMARGDPAGAIAFYEQAIERGPRWADPQKYWGDALIAQGDETGAIRKYRAAAERAPQWGALHLAWGRALEAQNKGDQAREKYTEAARMDLSAADRAEVVRRLGAVSRGS